MKSYLLFFVFILINNRCHEGYNNTALNKQNCFVREINKEEFDYPIFDENPDSCCFFEMKASDIEFKTCVPYPKDEAKKIIKYWKLEYEFNSRKVNEISLDCISQFPRIKFMILIILLILINY